MHLEFIRFHLELIFWHLWTINWLKLLIYYSHMHNKLFNGTWLRTSGTTIPTSRITVQGSVSLRPRLSAYSLRVWSCFCDFLLLKLEIKMTVWNFKNPGRLPIAQLSHFIRNWFSQDVSQAWLKGSYFAEVLNVITDCALHRFSFVKYDFAPSVAYFRVALTQSVSRPI